MRFALFATALCVTACASALAAPTSTAPAPGRACQVDTRLTLTGAQREEVFATLESAEGASILLGLPDCLDAPDPAIRDGYAFELISVILRRGNQSEETVRALRTRLLDALASAGEDPNGFRGPFAVLALSEVARVDRRTPFLSEEERWDTLAAARAFLAVLTDYRGFSDTEGWRHGVAHTADLLMQMSLNPHLTKPQAEEILAIVALKAGPTEHAYVFGESDRLAAPVLYLAQQEFFTGEEWDTWFASHWPADDPLRETMYKSEAALARLHNLRAFCQAVYISAAASDDPAFEPLAQSAFAMLKSLY